MEALTANATRQTEVLLKETVLITEGKPSFMSQKVRRTLIETCRPPRLRTSGQSLHSWIFDGRTDCHIKYVHDRVHENHQFVGRLKNGISIEEQSEDSNFSVEES
jgi:hypothetical protein